MWIHLQVKTPLPNNFFLLIPPLPLSPSPHPVLFYIMNAEYDYLMKIIVAGNSGCGKSSLLCQYVDKIFSDTFIATIGVDFKIKNLNLKSGKTAKLQIWDTAGQDRFRTIVASYWRGADGVVFVFDLTDLTSFEAVKHWAQEVDRYGSQRVQKILVGNKCDLTAKRVVTREMGEALATSMGIKYIETSAKTMENVDQAFVMAAETVASNYQDLHGMPPGANSKKINPTPIRGGEKIEEGTCCTLM